MQPLRDQLVPAGVNHPWVQRYLDIALHRRGGPVSGAALESLGLIEAALRHGATMEALLVCPELVHPGRVAPLVSRSLRRGVPALSVSPRTFARLTNRDGPDGLAAVARWLPSRLGDLSIEPVARVLVLDRMELPGNVGSLIRSAAAVSAAAVLVTGDGARLSHPLVVKASVGAIFSVPTCRVDEGDALDWLRQHRFDVVAADPCASIPYRDATVEARVAVVLGSERHGLSPLWRRSADQLVAIPMHGRVDSLNVGHAGALLLFEAAHQQGTL